MKELLEKLFAYHNLSYEEARQALRDIANKECNHSQVAAFLTVYQMRSITVDELRGFRDALLELALPVDLSAYETIDLCGTGGDGKDTFNISTLSSFVTAGAGIKVAKHGNYSVSSSCGSSNVMEHFGYNFSNEESLLQKQIEEAGICFLHAPLFHPAMKTVAPIRKELAVKTFFNMLGPMVNPARPQKQMVGVFSLELARLYQYLYQQGDVQYSIVHALDGYDEISLTGDFKQITPAGEKVLSPQQIGLSQLKPQELKGGKTVKRSADIFLKILSGYATDGQRQAVLANSATAISTASGQSFEEALMRASESLDSGQAYNTFKKLIEISQKSKAA